MDIPTQRPDQLTGIALCAGVGGLEIGLHVAEPGYRTVCFVERDTFAATTLVARMADKALCDAPVWDDVKTFDGRGWRGKVGVLTAGYPCQPFSSSGHRRGADDPRHLWPHVSRIIGEIQPGRVFLENVLGHVDIGFDIVARELQGMGYAVEAGLFSAAETGASHWRTRLFILADANSGPERQSAGVRLGPDRGSDPGAAGVEGITDRPLRGHTMLDGSLAVDQGAEPAAGEDYELPVFSPGPFDLPAWDAALARNPRLQPCLLGMDHGVAFGVDRSAAAGNGVVSLAAAYAWRTLKARHDARRHLRDA